MPEICASPAREFIPTRVYCSEDARSRTVSAFAERPAAAWVEKVHRAGLQVNCHTNGDVAIAMYLDAFERAQKRFPRTDARPKITHCTLINDDLVRRMKALDAVPALFTSYAYYNSEKFPFYGEDPHTVNPERIKDLEIVRTVVGGETMYQH